MSTGTYPFLSASVIRSRIAPSAGSAPASDAERDDQPDAGDEVPPGQHEERQQPAGRIAVCTISQAAAEAETAADDRDEQRLGQHQRQDAAVRRSPASSARASSLVRSRTACAMVLPATSRIVKNTAPRMRDHDRPDVADLLGEAVDEPLLGGRLGLGRGVGEHLVERRRHLAATATASAILTTYQPTEPVADVPRLVEVVVAEEEVASCRRPGRRRRCRRG